MPKKKIFDMRRNFIKLDYTNSHNNKYELGICTLARKKYIARDSLKSTDMQLYFSKSENLVGYEFKENLSAIEFTEIEIAKGTLSELNISVIFTHADGTKTICPVQLIPHSHQLRVNGKVRLMNNIIMPKPSHPHQATVPFESVFIECGNAEDFNFNLTCGLFTA